MNSYRALAQARAELARLAAENERAFGSPAYLHDLARMPTRWTDDHREGF